MEANEGLTNQTGKSQDLQKDVVLPEQAITTDQGVKYSDDKNSLKVGSRGPTLLEDFVLREKITHFDHERIPERVVHARGAAAHGYFQVYKPLTELTMAKFLQDPALQTPVFVRFSNVAGSRGAADTSRDVRGFATKFYTEDGNFDLVGNNIPVFFIQDAIKFPDLIHANKPEPHHEIPQDSTAHDTFWDFISLTPESMHMVMWIMSDRAIPRSYATMEGFGVHTFRLVNAQGVSRFVKFHWKPLLGVQSLVWDEALKLAGADPDFHRRDMWENIELGNYFEYELGIQVMEEADVSKYDFDILDATKVWPEDLIPVQRVGKMTLNRNPDNYFAETEQVAYHIGNVVPGIDFSDDPLLHGRLFSYLDTQLLRLGGPNFTEIPINRPLNKVSNNQRDGFKRHSVNPGRVSYSPNSLGGDIPEPAPEGSYVSYPERLEGRVVRERSQSFGDHYGQARLFWNSMTQPEQRHIISALHFELGRVETRQIRLRMLEHLAKINEYLAAQVALGLGETVATNPEPTKARPTPPANVATNQPLPMSPTSASGGLQRDSKLSGIQLAPNLKGRRIAILAGEGVSTQQVAAAKTFLQSNGAKPEVIGPHLGTVMGDDGTPVAVDKNQPIAPAVIYDAVFLPGGSASVTALMEQYPVRQFLTEIFKHGKAMAAIGEGTQLLTVGNMPQLNQLGAMAVQEATNNLGVVASPNPADLQAVLQNFATAIQQHRNFNRLTQEEVPA